MKQIAFYPQSNWNYYLTHPWEIVTDYYYEFKHFVQRGLYGYAECDTWSLDTYLSSWMPTALRQLATETHGWFPTAAEDKIARKLKGKEKEAFDNKCFKKWQDTIRKMAWGFELGDEMDNLIMKDLDPKAYKKKYTELSKKEQKYLTLFIKNYHALWD